jgi:hypothetical protein
VKREQTGGARAGCEIAVYVLNPDELRVAFAFGADRAIVDTSRTRYGSASQFDLHSLEWAINHAAKHGKSVTVWLGISPSIPRAREADRLADSLKRIGAASAIIRDPCMIALCGNAEIKDLVLDPSLPIRNAAAAEFWHAMGVQSWFAGFDLSAFELEALLSSAAGKGAFVYGLAAMTSAGAPIMPGSDGEPRYSFASLHYLPRFLNAGMKRLALFPPEGGAAAVAAIVRAFAAVLRGKPRRANASVAMKQLNRAIRLPVSRGFFPGRLHIPPGGRPPAGRLLSAEVAGVVREYYSDQRRVRVVLKAPIRAGEEMLLMTPEADFRFRIGYASIMDKSGSALEAAAPGRHREVSMFLPAEAAPYSLILRA